MRRTVALLLSLLAPSPAPAGGPESPGAAGGRPTFEATATACHRLTESTATA